MILYAVVRAIVAGLVRVAFRVRVAGAEHVPASGAFVFAPSHRSLLDTPFLVTTTRRRIRFMGKSELWKVPGLGALFSALGAFPVDRKAADRIALRTAMECVAAGEPVAIFPEGTRRTGARIVDLHDGAAYVAARLGVPVVPVGIAGSEEILPRGKRLPRFRPVTVVVGEPIDPPRRGGAVRRRDVKALTAQLETALQKVFDEAQELRAAR